VYLSLSLSPLPGIEKVISIRIFFIICNNSEFPRKVDAAYLAILETFETNRILSISDFLSRVTLLRSDETFVEHDSVSYKVIKKSVTRRWILRPTVIRDSLERV